MNKRSEVRIDARKIINEYMEDGDIAKENANQNKGPSGLLMSVGSEGLRRNTLKEMVENGFEEIVDFHNKGIVHIHDLGMGTPTPYCCGNSLPNLLATGISVGVEAGPAKHFNSAINHMVNFIGSQSNDYSGAQAFNGVDTYLAPYAYKKYLDFKKAGCAPSVAFRLAREDIYQSVQNFIFHLNMDTRYGNQKPFSNITLDITIPYDMKDELALVAGQPIKAFFDYTSDGIRVNNHTYGDLWEWQRLVAEAFIDTFNEGDKEGKSFTFPVLTLNVDNSFFDHPLTDKICEFTAKYGIPFFQNFVNGESGGEKMDPRAVRAMCPLHPTTPLFVKSSKQNEPAIRNISDVYTGISKNIEYSVLHNGEWKECSAIQVETTAARIIKTNSGVEVNMSNNHLQPVKYSKYSKQDIITADRLEVGMYVPFASTSIPEKLNNKLAGIAVGAFIGDGSYSDNGIIYSLNNSTKQELLHQLKMFYEGMGYRCGIYEGQRNVVFLSVKCFGKAVQKWMSQFVPKENALDKHITNKVYVMGSEFVEGILEGWYATDGGNSGRIYTASEALREDFKNMCGYLGKNYNVDMKGDTRECRYSDSPVYTLKTHIKQNYGDYFFFEDDMYWHKIVEIEDIKYNTPHKYYCLVINEEDHLFQLANGFITHNCRLNLNLAEIANTTGGLFGNSDGTGSLMVVTLNLPYIAHESNGNMKVFNARLKYVMERIRELHLWKRNKVNEALHSGFLALSKKTLPKGFDTFFTTVGFIGLWECVEILNKDENSLLTDNGLELGEEILSTMTSRTKKWVEQYKALWNVEETPAESASYKLAKKSLKQFPDIIHRGLKKAPYFTNGCNIPVEFQDDLMRVLRVRTRLQSIPNGGTATHFYIGEEWSVEQTKEFIRTICQTTIPYFSISTVYSICPICGYKVGAHDTCPNQHTPEQIEKLRRTNPELIID
jgi:anaerobic ribonucleoside-triphosphate reductase